MTKNALEFTVEERGNWSTDYPEYGFTDKGKWFIVKDSNGIIYGGFSSKPNALLAIPKIIGVLNGTIKVNIVKKVFERRDNVKNYKKSFQKK